MGRGEELLGALWFCLRAEDYRAVVHRRRPREPSLPSLSQSVSSSVLFRSRSLSDHLRHGHVPRQHPVLPLSSHVGAGTSLFPHCPASCVEEGRWHPSGAGFVPSLVLNVFHVFCGEIYSRSGVAGLPQGKQSRGRGPTQRAGGSGSGVGAAFAWSLSSCVARRSCSQSSGIFYHRLTLFNGC